MDNTEKKQEPNPFLAEKRKFSYILGFFLIIVRLPLFFLCFIAVLAFNMILWPLPTKIRRIFILLINFVFFRLILILCGVIFIKSSYKLCTKSKRMTPMRSGSIVLSNCVSFLDVFYLNYIASPLFLRGFFKLNTNESQQIFEPLTFFQTFSLAFSSKFINPKPYNEASPPNKLINLSEIKRNSVFKKLGPLVIFHEGTKTNGSATLAYDMDLMGLIHDEVSKDKTNNLNLIKFSYPDNKFPVYSNSCWFINLLSILANPVITINITIYNPIFSNNFPMDKDKFKNIIDAFYSDETRPLISRTWRNRKNLKHE